MVNLHFTGIMVQARILLQRNPEIAIELAADALKTRGLSPTSAILPLLLKGLDVYLRDSEGSQVLNPRGAVYRLIPRS